MSCKPFIAVLAGVAAVAGASSTAPAESVPRASSPLAATLCEPLVRGRVRGGDVTGDGRVDSVRLVAEASAAGGCHYWLVADSGERRYRVRVPYRFGPRKDIPWLNSLATIDRIAGADIVVSIDRGAAITRVSVYAVRGGHLVPLRGRSFGYGPAGSVAQGVDCVAGRRGRLVHSSAQRTVTGGWNLERRFYKAIGKLFVATRTVRARVESLRAFSEFGRRFGGPLLPFPSCTVRRVVH